MTTTRPPAVSRSPLGRAYAEHVARSASTDDPTAAALDSVILEPYRERFMSAPAFLAESECRAVARDLRTVYDLLRALPERVFDGDLTALAEAVGMDPRQTALITRGARAGSLVPLGRADLYHDGAGFRLLEFNLTSALGGFESADINRAMLAYPPLREFVDRHGLRYPDTLGCIVRMMYAECAPMIPTDRPPVVAVVDTTENYPIVGGRLEVFAELLAGYGIEGIGCHLGQFTYPQGRPTVAGRAVDVVVRYFLPEDLADPVAAAQVEPLLVAAEQEKVGLFSRLDAELYGNKGTLAMLSDDRHRHLFDADELACVDRLLPWTRHVRPRGTDPEGAEVDLLAYARARQDELILKPTLLHGGNGVLAGWTVGGDEWQARLDAALDGPYVLQRRVRPAAEPFADGVGGVRDLYLNWGVYLADRDVVDEDGYAGCLVRGSTDPGVGVVSMAGGAKIGCTFHGG
ncbi:hypothetical protein F6X68_30650 [Micromonospora sp. AMSO12t]|uniref:hypothetical protein n=1 Tax=Micromonospora sp. AMSO12t TaxID=2650410 RepID=UPI00124AE6E4|nr:hypothetical protein [Micromonospora sp. AMSO12t]KAB1128687.1 hypothetical protein F6X68_30650 [Micromonospora sp. AMSO12t]